MSMYERNWSFVCTYINNIIEKNSLYSLMTSLAFKLFWIAFRSKWYLLEIMMNFSLSFSYNRYNFPKRIFTCNLWKIYIFKRKRRENIFHWQVSFFVKLLLFVAPLNLVKKKNLKKITSTKLTHFRVQLT